MQIHEVGSDTFAPLYYSHKSRAILKPFPLRKSYNRWREIEMEVKREF